MSIQARLLNQVLHLNKGFWRDITTIDSQLIARREQQLCRWLPNIPEHIAVNNMFVKQVPVQELSAANAQPNKVLLYFHGGGFIAGSPETSHRDYLWRVAEKTGCRLWAVAYRKLPDNPFPAALDDACQVYRHLAEEHPSCNICIAGDSAGGGLALSLVLKLKNEGMTLPAAVVAFSPWSDLTCSGESLVGNRRSEVMIPEHLLASLAREYAGQNMLTDPYISPLFGDFNGFPPTMMMASDVEILLDDSLRVADKMREADVPLDFCLGEGLPHAWPVFARFLPEGKAALSRFAEFVEKHC